MPTSDLDRKVNCSKIKRKTRTNTETTGRSGGWENFELASVPKTAQTHSRLGGQSGTVLPSSHSRSHPRDSEAGTGRARQRARRSLGHSAGSHWGQSAAARQCRLGASDKSSSVRTSSDGGQSLPQTNQPGT